MFCRVAGKMVRSPSVPANGSRIAAAPVPPGSPPC